MSPSLDKPWYPVEAYRGHVISQRGRTYRVGDLRFKRRQAAYAYIDSLISGETQ